jgi:hypothetical protein
MVTARPPATTSMTANASAVPMSSPTLVTGTSATASGLANATPYYFVVVERRTRTAPARSRTNSPHIELMMSSTINQMIAA